jgi:hypothetical protein
MYAVQLLLQCDARAVLRASASAAVSITLTASGLPCITLANSHAYMFHSGLEEWMRVADWGFPASMHHTCIAGAVRQDVAAAMAASQAQRPMPAVFDVARMVRFHLSPCLGASRGRGCHGYRCSMHATVREIVARSTA